MRTPDQALAWLEDQRRSGSTAWANRCESLCRQAYGLPAHYSSAELHAKAMPSRYSHGHETPRRGDLVLYVNGGAGHIVVATGNGWECYTNDYGGRGKVTKADARNLVSWCRASSWFVADAWWSSSSFILTHTPPPQPKPPEPQPIPTTKGDEMYVVDRKLGASGDGKILVEGGRMVGLVKSSWDASPAIRSLPTLVVTERGQWDRLTAAYGQPT